MSDDDTVSEPSEADGELIPMPEGAIRVPRGDRAAGLGHVRQGIRRRASLSPLIFLIAAAIVIVVLAVVGNDDADSDDGLGPLSFPKSMVIAVPANS